MERKKADLVVKELNKYKDITFTIQDAMCMSHILSDVDDVYAIKKGETLFLAKFSKNRKSEKCVDIRIIKW